MTSTFETFGAENPFGTGIIDMNDPFNSFGLDSTTDQASSGTFGIADYAEGAMDTTGVLAVAQRIAKNAYRMSPEQRAWIDDWIRGLIVGGVSMSVISSVLAILGPFLASAGSFGLAVGYSIQSKERTNRKILSREESESIMNGNDFADTPMHGLSESVRQQIFRMLPEIETYNSNDQQQNAIRRQQQMDHIVNDLQILSEFEGKREHQKDLSPDNVEKAAAKRLSQIPGTGVVIIDKEENFSATGLNFLYFDADAPEENNWDRVPLLRSVYRNTIGRILNGKVKIENEAHNRFYNDTITPPERRRELVLRNLTRRWAGTPQGRKTAQRTKKSKTNRVQDIFHGAEIAYGHSVPTSYFDPNHPRFWAKDPEILPKVLNDFKTELRQSALNNTPDWKNDTEIVKKLLQNQSGTILDHLYSFELTAGRLPSISISRGFNTQNRPQNLAEFRSDNPNPYPYFSRMGPRDQQGFLDKIESSEPLLVGEAIIGDTDFQDLSEPIKNAFQNTVNNNPPHPNRAKLTRCIRNAKPNSNSGFSEAVEGNIKFSEVYKHRVKTFSEIHAEGAEKGFGLLYILRNYIGHRVKNAILPPGWEAAAETAWGIFQSSKKKQS